MADYIFPFFNEAMDSSMIKINVFKREKLFNGIFLPLPRFPRFYLEKTTEGTGRGGNLMKQVLGDVVRSGSQGNRVWLWSLSLCCREGGTAGSAMSFFRKVGAPSPSRWSIGGS